MKKHLRKRSTEAISSSPGKGAFEHSGGASSPVGLVDQSLEGHLLLEGVIILQTLQGGQFGQTLQADQGEGDEERQRVAA